MANFQEQFVLEFKSETKEFESALGRLQTLSDTFASSITRGFADVAVRGRSVSDVINDIALSLTRVSLARALKPVEDLVGSAIGGFVPSLAGALGGSLAAIPFARGGVLSSPALAALPGQRLGVIGEAGPEAVLPLTRGSDGRLGVRSQAGAGAAVSVVFNVNTPDAASFRRSEAQITAMLARATDRGRREL